MTLRPHHIAAACALVGAVLVVGGVYLLAGPAWALMTAGLPLLVVGAVALLGLSEVPRAE